MMNCNIPNLDSKTRNLLLTSGAAAVVGAAASLEFSEAQTSSGTVPADVQTAIGNTIATVQALGPIALACISVALVPFGAALALSFVHKVMGKA